MKLETAAARPCQSTYAWPAVILTCLVVWGVMRVVFFAGIQGSDDLFHIRYAALWDRAPINHWEARLLANAMMAGAMKLLGRTELAAALPSIAASFMILSCVLYWCYRYADVRHAWWAGLLVSVLPMDVGGATTPSAYPLMTALLIVGTLAFLRAPQSRRARLLAAITLSLGVVTHLAGSYYVASLMLVILCIDRPRFQRSVVTVFVAGVLVMAADMALFHFSSGDAMGRFHIVLPQTPSENPQAPLYVNNRFNWMFAVWPIQHMIYSKQFGIALGLILGWGAWNYRRLPFSSRILFATSVVFWLWMSFGSQIPWAYKPFWRMMRFLAPLTLPVSVLFASAIVTARRRWLASITGVTVLVICPLSLAASGSWGQSVQISRELRSYADQHPETRFITDFHTINEMYVLNGMQLPPNVVTPDNFKRSHLINRDAARIPESHILPSDRILDNPLNTWRTPSFAQFLEAHAGTLQHEGKPTFRMICRLMPPLCRYPWAVRKPPARVFECRISDRPDEPQP